MNFWHVCQGKVIYLSYSSTILKVSPDLHQHNFKEQGQDPGTCEVCCANDVHNNIKEAWRSDRRDGETFQCIDAGSASVSSPTQLNADSREIWEPSWRLEEETRWSIRASFNASHGWFHRFKARASLHNVKVNGKAASADLVAARERPETLWEMCWWRHIFTWAGF